MTKKTEKGGGRANAKSSVGFVVSLVLFALAVLVFIMVAKAKSENRPASFFGYSFSVVASPSMEPEIMVGDLIIVKDSKIEDAKLGDWVVYVKEDGVMAGQFIVHEVVAVFEDEKGVAITTRGINNDSDDALPVHSNNFIGHVTFVSSFLGAIVSHWVLIVILIAAALIAVSQIKRIIVYSRQLKTESATEAQEEDPENNNSTDNQ